MGRTGSDRGGAKVAGSIGAENIKLGQNINMGNTRITTLTTFNFITKVVIARMPWGFNS